MMRRLVLLGVAIVAVLGAGVWFLHPWSAPVPLSFQGYIEGELLFIGPEEAGRVERLAVRAGDSAEAGASLFDMDSVIQAAQRDAAAAGLAQARAQLENQRAAQNRPEQIAVLQAAQARAQAALDFSEKEFERQRSLVERGITPRAQFDQARANRDRDRAALEEAQRQIAAARLGGRSAEIAAGEAAVAAAEAGLRQAQARLDKRHLAAPQAGVVQDIFFRPGETVGAAQPVLALLPPEGRKVRFYVPEGLLAQAPLGTPVVVHCDGCRPEGLPARISFASREAEFTPPIIFSRTERARLVFRMEARFDAPVPTLPLGLPAQVVPVQIEPGSAP